MLRQGARGEVHGVARALGGRRKGRGGKLDGESTDSLLRQGGVLHGGGTDGGGGVSGPWIAPHGGRRGARRMIVQWGVSDPRPAGSAGVNRGGGGLVGRSWATVVCCWARGSGWHE
jgi:hypothetical protein